MTGFHQRFVGTRAFPKTLTDIDVSLCFQLSSDDVRALRESFKDRALGPAILLVFQRASGRSLEKLTAIPHILLKYLCAELGANERQIATIRSLYKRAATLTEHKKWVLHQSKMRQPSTTDLQDLAGSLKTFAASSTSVDDLVARAERWLLEHQFVIPHDRIVRSVASKAFEAEVAAAIHVIRTKVPDEQLRTAIVAIFSARKGRTGGTILEWLKEPAGKHGLKSLKEASQKISYLKSLGVDQWDLGAIGGERIRAYARSVMHRPPSATRARSDDTQALEVSCFLRATLLEFTDNLFYTGGRQLNRMIGQGRNRVQSQRAKSAADYAEREERVRALIHAEDTTDRQKVEALQTMFPKDQPLQNLSGSALVRDYLAGERLAMGAVLQAFSCIEIHGPEDDDALAQAAALRELHQQGAKELPPNFAASIVHKGWHDLIKGVDRQRAFGALQASAALAIHKGLRGGSLWVDHSWKHRNREDFLIPQEEWERDRRKLLNAMNLVSDPKLYLKRVRHNVEIGLQAVSEALDAGKLEINADCNVSLPRLAPQDIDMQVSRSRDTIFKIIGQARVENIVIEVDAKTNFSEALLGRKAKTVQQLVALYGGVFAMGTENDAAGVASMIPGIEVSHIAAAMRTLENAERVRAASERVHVFQREHPIAAHWGKGDKGSADMMALDASNRLFNARVDPRRRTFAVGIYTHVLNSYGVFYDQPIVLNTRQAAAAVQGAHWYNAKQPADRRLAWLAVDTHGYAVI